MRMVFDIVYRMLKFMLLALMVYAFVQTLPLDVALLLAGDTLFYCEIVASVWMAAQVTRLKWILAWIRFVLRPRARLRLLKSRARRGLRAARRRLALPPPPDPDGRWGALAPA